LKKLVKKLVQILCMSGLFLSAPAVMAQATSYDFVASALIGVGGGLDEDDVGFGSGTFQLGIAMPTESDILVGLRLGQMSFDSDDSVGDLTDFSLTYATVVGEYVFAESYYTSGIFFGLGAYELDATNVLGGDGSDTSAGLTLGLTGEWDVTRRWGFRVEIAGHYLASTEISTVASALAGATYRF